MTIGDFWGRLLRLGSAGQTRIRTGTGTPEAVVTGAIGDLFLRTDGGVGTSIYTKTSGSGNTGWTAIGGAAAGTVTTTGSPASGNLTKFSGAASVTNADLTGDVTTSGGVAATIAAAAVTLAKMANVATDRLLGRDTAGTGVPEALTVGGGVEFTGSGGIQTSAFTGDVTKSAGGTALTIANDAVTFAKIQNTSAATRLIGRGSAAGAGDPEEVTLGAGLSMAGTVLSSTVVGTGGGDFVGPGSSTNNGFVKYDGTTGKLGKDGAATVAIATEVSGLGTGVATALAINVGTAGSIGAMVKIEEQTPSATGTLTFASLGSYKHLEIRWSGRSTKAAINTEDLLIRFNADSGSNYGSQLLYNNAATTAAAFAQIAGSSGIIASLPAATATANVGGGGVIRIPDYRGTTFFKVATGEFHFAADTAGTFLTRLNGVTWANASAITSITLLLDTGNYVAGTIFTLYGLN